MASRPTYAYYTDTYGGSMPEDDWSRFVARADAAINRLESLHKVTQYDTQGRDMALCAVAETLADIEQAEAAANVSSVSVGSVSTSYDATRAGSIDLSPAARERAVLEAIRPYLHVCLGVQSW